MEDFIRDSSVKEIIRGQHLSTATNKDTELFMNAVTLPSDDDAPFFKHLSRIHTTLSTREPFLNVPKGLEARRRISFFSNSLFMTMPRAPQVIFNVNSLSFVFSLPNVTFTVSALFILGANVYLSMT